jgi:hypothetical protein
VEGQALVEVVDLFLIAKSLHPSTNGWLLGKFGWGAWACASPPRQHEGQGPHGGDVDADAFHLGAPVGAWYGRPLRSVTVMYGASAVPAISVIGPDRISGSFKSLR